MQSVIFVLLAVIAATSAQPFDALRAFRGSDSVLFTTYNVDTEKGFLEYAPADPNNHDIGSDDFLNTSMLIYTKEGLIAEYWGMTASRDDGKIWLNNYRKASLVEYNVNENKLIAVAKDLTNGLENLAYDRVTKVLYWTDSIEKAIFAMEKSYQHFSIIYKSANVAPYALALHTTKRKLFFSVYKTERNLISSSELVKCDLDGTKQQTLLRFPDVIRPRGITIDFSQDKLFWTDMNLDRDVVVMACDLDGRLKRQFFAKTSGFLWGVAHYENYIYVTDVLNTSLNEYDIHIRNIDGRRGTTVKTKLRPRNVAIYAENEVSRTKVPNECDVNRCDHMCIASSGGRHVCKCSIGYQLKSASGCQSSPLDDDYLIIADVGQKQLLQLPIESSASRVDEIVAVSTDDETKERIFAIAVGPKTGVLAWHSQENKEIVWGERKLAFAEAVSSIAFHCCEDKIFWATTSAIFSWDGKASKAESIYVLSFFSNSEIRQLTIDCFRNQIYWIEYDTIFRKSTLKRSDLMGKDVETVLRNLPVSKGLTIDYETYTLHVMSMIEGMLYSSPLKMLEKITSTEPSSFQFPGTDLKSAFGGKVVVIFDIKVINGMVYLADSESSQLWRFSISKGPKSMEAYGPKTLFFPATIDFYDRQHYWKHMREACDEHNDETTALIDYDADDEETAAATTTTTTTTARTAKRLSKGLDCMAVFKMSMSTGDFTSAFLAYMECLNLSSLLG